MPTYRYIENEGVLFRTTGPSNAFPHEIWSPKQKQFLLYQGDVPKPQDWGEEISEAEAQGIAQSRARGARFVGSLGMRGSSYVFRFERNGEIIDIAVDSRG